MQGGLNVFKDLRPKGIPYSRNQLHALIKKKLFPPGRRFTKKGRRHWTDEEIDAAKARMADPSFGTNQET
jgi:hypothetical protein